MVTIERYYSSPDDVRLVGGAHGDKFNIVFAPEDGSGVYIKVSALGRESFGRLVETFTAIGRGLLEVDKSV